MFYHGSFPLGLPFAVISCLVWWQPPQVHWRVYSLQSWILAERDWSIMSAINSAQGGRQPTDLESAYLGTSRTLQFFGGLRAGIASLTGDWP